MPEYKTYPPAFIKPGETTKASFNNGEVEFIGVYDDKVVDFFVAAYELLKAIDGTKRPSPQQIGFLERKAAKAFNVAPNHLKKIIMEKLNPGSIWLPDNQEGEPDAG